ncbi:50S ribosomal protein L25/general stress protein Ctc [Rhodoplanes sp. SY1]|uniref:50S ribosomal protein L25/general stress protein Ctc n=1 Tax=Rhodoplanes sp. SY1 TaxID=3166646 RepID=UPI0038B64724
MTTVKELKATSRPRAGKGAARAVRREGRVPGVIYGDNKPPVTISLDSAELRQRIFAGHFLTTIFDVELDGTKHRVIPRDYQLEPLQDRPVHVDFMRLGEGATIRVRVPIRTVNPEGAPGIKRGGTVNIVTHAVELRCPADAIPESIEIDLAGMEINHSRHLSDITLPPNVKTVGKLDPTLVTLVPPSGYAEEQRAAKDAAAAPAAGAAAPAAGAKAPAAGAKAPAGDAKAAAGAKKPDAKK